MTWRVKVEERVVEIRRELESARFFYFTKIFSKNFFSKYFFFQKFFRNGGGESRGGRGFDGP